MPLGICNLQAGAGSFSSQICQPKFPCCATCAAIDQPYAAIYAGRIEVRAATAARRARPPRRCLGAINRSRAAGADRSPNQRRCHEVSPGTVAHGAREATSV
jgi:hypothetical protein